jgi:hypothetical protein
MKFTLGYQFDMVDLNVGGFQEIHRILVDPVGAGIYQTDDTGIDQRFGAVNAREVCHVAG